MVLPDGTVSTGKRPKTGRAVLFVLAGIITIAGVVAMGSLTRPDPTAIAETTTTSSTSTTLEELTPPIDVDNFSIDQIARGRPFEWESAMILDDSYPIAMFDHDGWIYLFSTEQPNFSGFEEGGLRAWRTIDGASWEPLGQVIPERHVITAVNSTGQGLVAMETGEEGPGFRVWRSLDGEAWSPEDVAVETGSRHLGVFPMAVGGSDDILVVAGNVDFRIWELIQERIGQQLGDDIDISRYGFSTNVIGDDVEFDIYGPLGSPMASFTAEDLGLTRRQERMIAEDYNRGDSEAMVWARSATGWQESVIPDATWLESITATPDGEIVAMGYGEVGLTRWRTEDGLSWTEDRGSFLPYRIDEWGDLLVGPASGSASVVVEEGDEWREIGPHDHFPTPISWNLGPTAAGPTGVATMVFGWPSDSRGSPASDPVTLTNEDSTLTIDFGPGTIELEVGVNQYGWSMYDTTREGVDFDLETGTVVFSDPKTGEPLATYPIDEISDAENAYWSGWNNSPDMYQAFAFTADGEEWTIQDRSTIGEDVDIRLLEVTDTHVIAAGTNNAGMFNPTLTPGFGVWSAPIP